MRRDQGVSISLFDEPPRISIKGMEGMRNGLLLGLAVRGNELAVRANELAGVVLLEDGTLTYLDPSDFVVDWRYDAVSDRWIDTSMPKASDI